MLERRRRTSAPDSGERRRGSDHIKTPHRIRELPATYYLRWAEHVKHEPHKAA